MSNIQVEYDENSDLLSVYRKESKIRREVDVGDMVIQFDGDGQVVGFEMFNASDFLILEDNSIKKTEFLKNLESAKLNVKYTENAIQIESYISSRLTEESGMVTSQAPAAAPV